MGLALSRGGSRTAPTDAMDLVSSMIGGVGPYDDQNSLGSEHGAGHRYRRMDRVPVRRAGGPHPGQSVCIYADAPAGSRVFERTDLRGHWGRRTGGRNQFRVAEEMVVTYWRRPFGFILTTGDNVYFGDVVDRAEAVIDRPYRPLFDAGVAFRPTVGNHDLGDPDELEETLAALGMPDRYYAFSSGPVDFFALDSNRMDGEQLAWFLEQLSCSKKLWQVVYMHHPLYSSGKHGSDMDLREILEPVLVAGGADLVLSGHDHNYERTTPQRGIVHVVTGGGGRALRHVGSSSFTAVSDSEFHFVLADVSRNEMRLSAIKVDGEVIDSFSIRPRQGLGSCTEAKEPRL